MDVEDTDQTDAVVCMAYFRCAVITGSPGTGKSATLRKALPLLEGKRIALVAPTGKAARRMAEVTGYQAGTIHKMLGLKPKSRRPQYGPGNPLPYDVIFIDEASMVDNDLMGMVFAACDISRTRVILIGDVNQLPSVGPGQVLHDLIESNTVPVVRLHTVHRAAADSWICRVAPEILKGRFDWTEGPGFRFIETEDVLETCSDVTARLVATHGSDDVQVIVPMNVGEYGTRSLNVALQTRLNPGGDSPSFTGGPGTRIRAGDRVVQMTNDYDRAIFNGELGVVTKVEGRGDGSVTADFVDRDEASYSKTEAAENLKLAYALTVHRFQGSEIKWVVLVLHEEHGPMLTRRLLYTAVTRAKEGVVIIGQRSAVLRALLTQDREQRYTTLRKRIAKCLLEEVKK